ncbi:SGNH/GDSL hydrolase family protein [uncultured Streptomyces sp.]|uniref:SGNH/GDSL hydrolase family protein n=1 Tax=uncultured Streptomyces sp. TaxID=174707 RepID=UPI00260D38C8|nr:SGNH/GDSL hydrolase family protein [uncultured Streptomyces sp.]
MSTRRQGYSLLIALVAVTAVLAAALATGTALFTDGAGKDTAGDPKGGHTSRGPAARAAAAGHWNTTWAGSPTRPEPSTVPSARPDALTPQATTVRNVVHTSIGGRAARITLSNLFGKTPLVVDRATVERQPVRFGGRSAVTVPVGRQTVSDAVDVTVPADADLTVTVHTPGGGGPVTFHPQAGQTSYVTDGHGTHASTAWRYLTSVEVFSTTATGTVVTFGDSLTAGSGSTVDAESGWPDVLSDRLGGTYAVANQGIPGNRLLLETIGSQSGLLRFDRDVLGVAGVKTVIISLGINDVQNQPSGTDPQLLIDGLRTLAERARAHGLRVVGATLTPFGGRPSWTPQREATRRTVNTAIRTGHLFDAYVDFDRVVRDPYAPARILPDYDCGDHLHFNDAGYRALGHSIDVRAVTDRAAKGAL